MAGEYEKAISIKDAIGKINNRDYLLPAIQRKFVWSSHQICVLFDSIMRDYPINSFMMWEVNSEKIKNDYRFYEFIKGYCQRFNEENPHIKTNASFKNLRGVHLSAVGTIYRMLAQPPAPVLQVGRGSLASPLFAGTQPVVATALRWTPLKNFKAVIDGQQRLTSLYIGLNSTYAYKQPRVWWPSAQDDSVLPPRKLYLDLLRPLKSEDDDSLMLYNFKFLTDKQYTDSVKAKEKSHHWFCMHEVLEMSHEEDVDDVLLKIVMPFLDKNELSSNQFSRKTLLKLYISIRKNKTIHYFNETNQEIDHVLDIFIRTNSGGTKLDFSDLLMSIAVANWDGDFRQELDALIKEIHQSSEMGFYLGRDWVLKTCLMLTDVDVKFKVKNFKAEQVSLIQQQWKPMKACIKSVFKLIRRFGINPQSLTSKNGYSNCLLFI